jgi:hypothetical protein
LEIVVSLERKSNFFHVVYRFEWCHFKKLSVSLFYLYDGKWTMGENELDNLHKSTINR